MTAADQSGSRMSGPSEPSPDPGTARRTALGAVVRVLSGAYLSRAISEALTEGKLNGQDRSLVTELAYGTLRYLIALDSRLAPFLSHPDRLPPEARAALRLGAYELLYRGTPAYAAVDAWVEVAKAVSPKHLKLVNAVLRRVSEAVGDDTAQVAVDASQPVGDAAPDPERDLSLPSWLFARFVASLGPEAAHRAALGMLEPEPLWLTAYTPEAERTLASQGVEVRRGPELPLPPEVPVRPWPTSLSVRSPTPLAGLRAFQRGLVQPQNPASLYAARLVGAEEGDLVYDLAAGHGVKTAALAASGAEVVAVELSAGRSRRSQRNLRRLGLAARHVIADLSSGPSDALAPPGDSVLLDAPCSGTGTLRGNPEIKLRLKESDLAEMAATQARMLATAATAVRPGGTLVYAVCSLTPEEGVAQVERFLAATPGFEALGMPAGPPFVAPQGPGAYVLPVGGLDGFYLARLSRTA
ncbi:MAG TPA: transcription antitermination factor NusB [Trueperaceae bacterium]